MAKVWKRSDRDQWVADFRDAQGNRHRRPASSREAAERIIAEANVEARETPLLVAEDVTLAQYAEHWLSGLERDATLKPRTIASYRQLYRLHLEPTLGWTKLRQLHRVQVKELIATKRDKGLSKNTVRLIRATLSVMLAEAMDDGYIKSNAAALPSRRRGKKVAMSVAERLKFIRPFETEELDRVLAVAREKDAEYFPLYLLLARAGLRPGEALALQWGDLDFTKRKLTVERALSDGELGDTKTGITRIVDMSQELAAVLSALYRERQRQTLKHGWSEVPELVFVNARRNSLDLSWVRKRFVRCLAKAGVGGHRLYDLRHTFASLLLIKGAPITYVAAQLGHSKPVTTLQHYARWLPKSGVSYVDSLDTEEILAPKAGTNSQHQVVAA
jgi:integrase